MSIKEESKSASDNLPPRIVGNQVWCPVCKEHAQFIPIIKAAELASVSERTIYRYVEEGSVYTVRVAGKLRRVCTSCLMKQPQE